MTSPVSAAIHALGCACIGAAVTATVLWHLVPLLHGVARLSALIGGVP